MPRLVVLLVGLPCGGTTSLLAGPLLSLLGFLQSSFWSSFFCLGSQPPWPPHPSCSVGCLTPYHTPFWSQAHLQEPLVSVPVWPFLLILLFFTIPFLISSAFFPGLGLDSFLPRFCCLFPFCFCSLDCLCASQPAPYLQSNSLVFFSYT